LGRITFLIHFILIETSGGVVLIDRETKDAIIRKGAKVWVFFNQSRNKRNGD